MPTMWVGCVSATKGWVRGGMIMLRASTSVADGREGAPARGRCEIVQAGRARLYDYDVRVRGALPRAGAAAKFREFEYRLGSFLNTQHGLVPLS